MAVIGISLLSSTLDQLDAFADTLDIQANDDFSALVDGLDFGSLREFSLSSTRYELRVFDQFDVLVGREVLEGSGFRTTGFDGNPFTLTDDVLVGTSVVNKITLQNAAGQELFSLGGSVSAINFSGSNSQATVSVTGLRIGSAELGGYVSLGGSLTAKFTSTSLTIGGSITSLTMYGREGTEAYQLVVGGSLSPTASFAENAFGDVHTTASNLTGSITSLSFTRLTYVDGVATTPIGTESLISATGFTANVASLEKLLWVADDGLDHDYGIEGQRVAWIAGGTSNDTAYASATQADGKLVVVGSSSVPGTGFDFSLARINANGTLDTTFSGDGTTTLSLGTSSDIAFSVAVQADGRILVAGATAFPSGDFVLARYTSAGVLDTTFSGDGKLSTAIGAGDDRAFDIALQGNGKILVAGRSHDGVKDIGALVRYNADGSLDATFSGDGIATISNAAGPMSARALAVQADGKILVAGHWSDGVEYDIGVARFLADGTLDADFGIDGIAMLDSPLVGNDYLRDIAIQADGRIVVAGSAFNQGLALAARFNADGTLDTAFGGDLFFPGILLTSLTEYSPFASGLTFNGFNSIALMPDGRIALGGLGYAAPQFDPLNYHPRGAVARLAPDGTLDESFYGGTTVLPTSVGIDGSVESVQIAADGSILAVGSTGYFPGSFSLFNVAKVLDPSQVLGQLLFAGNDTATLAYDEPVTVDAYLGNDSVLGGNANDTLYGNAGLDTLDGGLGADLLVGGPGNDVYVVNDAGDQPYEIAAGTSGGLDVVRASINWTLGANLEQLLLLGSSNLEATGNALPNLLTGNGGSNTLYGAAGNDTLAGGSGNDTYVIDSAGDSIVEATVAGAGSADIVLLSGVNFSMLASAANVENLTVVDAAGRSATGNALANSMLGGAGNDTLLGDAGADTLRGGAGVDLYSGGAGNDLYVIDDTVNGAVEIVTRITLEAAGTGAGSIDTVLTSISFIGQLAPNVENVFLAEGAPGALAATGNALNNYLKGNNLPNKLFGGAGNDTLEGGGGNDTLYGGIGADRYLIDQGEDLVIESGGGAEDFVVSSADALDFSQFGRQIDNFLMADGAESIKANELANRIVGNAGDNTLDGGGGSDTMTGGAGADTYRLDTALDQVVEIAADAGRDRIEINQSYTLKPELEDLTLFGSGNINGTGSNLGNVIRGNDGANVLDGKGGVDTLVGGLGNDVYVIDSLLDVYSETDGVVLAGGGSDTLRSPFNYTLSIAGIENLELTGTVATAGTGDAGGNAIKGNGLANSLVGLAGSDTLDGGLGADTMVGGADFDYYVVDALTDRVDESVGSNTWDWVESTINFNLAAANVLGPVEGISLRGKAAVATGNALNNVIFGTELVNTLDGGAGADTLVGGLGNDVYVLDDAGDVVDDSFSDAATWYTSIDVGAQGTLYFYTNGSVLPGAISIDNVAPSVFIFPGFQIWPVGAKPLPNVDLVTSSILAAYTLPGDIENLTLTRAAGAALTGNALGNSLTGGAGNDTLDGAAGNDTMIGGAGNDVYYVDSQLDVITDSAGIDKLFASVSYNFSAIAAIEQAEAIAGTGTVNLVGNAVANILTGNDGRNSLAGGAGNDQLFGGGGSNTLDGGLGSDTLTGGGGDDTYVIDVLGDSIAGSDPGGIDTVRSNVSYTLGANLERLVLTGSAPSGSGNALDNWIEGNALANTLDGAAGNDTLVGGAGNDRYLIDSDEDVIVELAVAGGGVDTVFTSLTAFVLQNGLENLTFSGNPGSVMAGDGNAGNNVLVSTSSVMGVLQGLGGNDTLIGGTGDDWLDGGAGNDSLSGGLGNDAYIVNAAGDVIAADSGGVDRVIALFANSGGVAYSIAARADLEGVALEGTVLNAIGNAGNNVLEGSALGNSLSGGAGNDSLDGDAGNDTLEGGAGNDTLSGGADVDTASFLNETGAITASLLAGTASGAGSDSLLLVENLTGGKAGDNLTGDANDNVLDGSLGADTLTGGGGNDTYVIDNPGDRVNAAGGGSADTIRTTLSFDLLANGLTHITSGTVENLTLLGTAFEAIGDGGNNRIEGNAANNNLEGDPGDDTLIGGAGNDTLSGGAGTDTADYSATTGSITLTLPNGPGNMTVTGAAGTDTLIDIETVVGGSGSDWVVLAGASVSIDLAALSSLAGFENLRGTAGGDTLAGNAADNLLEGGLGNDSLTGGAGNDWAIFTGTAAIVASLLAGTAGGQGIDTLAGIENLLGGGGADSLTGDGNDNILDGGLGNDTLVGGAGNDSYRVNALGDRIFGESAGDADEILSTVTIDLRLGGTASLVVDAGSRAGIENLSLQGTAVAAAFGNESANILNGNSAANTLAGGGGNDVLDGGGGADSMSGGAGDDLFYVDNAGDKADETGGGGYDVVFSSVSFTLGAGLDELELAPGAANLNGAGGADANLIQGNDGNNSLSGGGGNDTLLGGDGNDTLEGGAGVDSLEGGAGDDAYYVDSVLDDILEDPDSGLDTVNANLANGDTWVLADDFENLVLLGAAHTNGVGTADDNLLVGNSGNNVLGGGGGADTLRGMGGSDIYDIDSADDVIEETITGSADTDWVVATDLDYVLGANLENLTLVGTDRMGTGNGQNNSITGDAGADTLVGDAGNDTLDGGAGLDLLIGGAGNDQLVVDSVDDIVVEDIGGGTDALASAAIDLDLNEPFWLNLENAVLLGGLDLEAAGNANPNLLSGNGGANLLSGGAGNDTLAGNGGDDTLDGGAGSDSMTGGAGNDTYLVDATADIVGVDSAGIDTVVALAPNSGATTYSIAARADLENITLAGGVPNATGNANANHLAGDAGSNSLAGGLGDDTLDGDAGNDTLDGGAGSDSMSGGAGNDLYVVDNPGDVALEAADEGIDTVNAPFNYTLGAELDNLVLQGAAVNGTGNGLANRITAAAGNGTLDGGGGNDTLDGGLGNDTLVGGPGDDVFLFDLADGLVQGGAGTDTLKVAALLPGTSAAPFALSILADARIEDVEAIDITGTGNNSILVSVADVARISDAAGELRIDGNAGDFVRSNDTWTLLGLRQVGDEYYTELVGEFDSQFYTLLLHPTLAQAITVD